MAQYIDKAAVMAEIEKIQDTTMDKNQNFTSSYDEGKFDALSLLDNYINTLEVKDESVSEDYVELNFDIIPYSANISAGGNEYYLQAKVTDKDLQRIGVKSVFNSKLKVKT